MKLSDINNLTLDNLGSWPLPAKIGALLIVCAAVMGGGYYKFIIPQQENLAKAEKSEAEKKEQFEFKQQKAANLEKLRSQLDVIKQTMGEMLQKLPSKTEVPDLLQSVSQAGLAAGLEFEIFKPGNEIQTDFYVELPIQIRVTGNYHEFGKFISAIAGLERIVTAHDINITPAGVLAKGGGGGKLIMQATAKTYRYKDEAEEQAASKNEKAKKPAKK